jgi:hypothetical protein
MMKNYLLLPACLAISACGGITEAVVHHTSPNGKVAITVSGKRGNIMEAFRTVIALTAYDFKEGKLIFDIFADDLKDENVTFEWHDNVRCLISITQRDGESRDFNLLATETAVRLS